VDGLFSVELDVDQSSFSGQALWLQVEVAGPVIGCREILPAPYALGLRPGAYVSGDEGFTADSGATTDHWSAICGNATGGSGIIYGVRGNSNAPSGRGVAG
jgi:hypothetical protein